MAVLKSHLDSEWKAGVVRDGEERKAVISMNVFLNQITFTEQLHLLMHSVASFCIMSNS